MLTKLNYSLIVLILTLTLTGCQLSRDSNADLEAEAPVTPTLTTLGGDGSKTVIEATPIPTIINVQPTATESLMGEGQAAENSGEQVAPTSQPADIAITPAANQQAEGVSTNTQGASPETFTPPEAETASAEPVIVNATTAGLPDGGPVAANPPAAQSGSYEVASDKASYGGSTYIVQSGDTLFSISIGYGTTVEAFMYANNLTSDLIYEGQVLNVPTGDTAYSPAPVYDQPQPGNYAEGGYHMVAGGETLFSIAQRYGSSVEAVAAANGLSYPYIIYEGQTLTIPAYGVNPGVAPADGGYYAQPDAAYPAPADGHYQPQTPAIAGTHTVAPGETLFSIALRYGTSAQAISVANGLANPNQIYVGQVLYLP